MVGVLVFAAGCTEDKVVKAVGDVPAVPTGVSSTTGDRQVEINWRGNNDKGVTDGYGVYRYTRTVDGVDQYELLGTVLASAGVVYDGDDVRWYSYIDDNVTNGVTYYYSVNAYNKWGESELSAVDVFDTPRPEGDATVRDYHESPSRAGFEFSRGRVVRYDDSGADIFFEYDPDFDSYFLFAANVHTDIQDFGPTQSLTDVGYVPMTADTAWSALGYLELSLNHSYLVWTADNHYAACRADSIKSNGDIWIHWAYQTAEGNRELKRGLVTRPQHDANYGKRKG